MCLILPKKNFENTPPHSSDVMCNIFLITETVYGRTRFQFIRQKNKKYVLSSFIDFQNAQIIFHTHTVRRRSTFYCDNNSQKSRVKLVPLNTLPFADFYFYFLISLRISIKCFCYVFFYYYLLLYINNARFGGSDYDETDRFITLFICTLSHSKHVGRILNGMNNILQ